MNCIFSLSNNNKNVQCKKGVTLASGFPISLLGNVIEEIKVA